MKKSVIIIVLVVIVALAGVAFAVVNSADDNSTQTTQDNTATEESDQASTANTIKYTDNGFSPSTLTVKAGTTITIKNNSSRPLQFSSDDHPEHTDDPELNLSTLSPGGSQKLTVTVMGTHGIHNHLDDSHGATLVIE